MAAPAFERYRAKDVVTAQRHQPAPVQIIPARDNWLAPSALFVVKLDGVCSDDVAAGVLKLVSACSNAGDSPAVRTTPVPRDVSNGSMLLATHGAVLLDCDFDDSDGISNAQPISRKLLRTSRLSQQTASVLAPTSRDAVAAATTAVPAQMASLPASGGRGEVPPVARAELRRPG